MTSITEEKGITILSIDKDEIEFKGEDSKDSPTGYWLISIKYLGKGISTKAKQAKILVNSISKKFIKTGRYTIDSKNGFYGFPIFKAVE